MTSHMSEANVDFLGLARHGRLSELRNVLTTLTASERRERLQAEDEHGNTALLLAIIFEYPNVTSLLLQFRETDPTHSNKRGFTALSLAARTKRPFVVNAVLHRLLCVERLDKGELITIPMLMQFLRSWGEPVSLKMARHNLIDQYAQLSLEALSLCVARAFMQLPGTCLCECVQLAAATQFRSRAVRGYDTYQADELEAASARLQLAVAGCLVSLGRLKDGLGRYEVEQLLQSPLGEAAIKLAIRHRCKHFLSQPPVQALLTHEWHGPLLHSIMEGADHTVTRRMGRCVVFLLVVFLNLLLLPLVAAFPPLENLLLGHLKQDAAEKLVASQLPERKTLRGSGVGSLAAFSVAPNGNRAVSAKGAASSPSPVAGRRRRPSWPSLYPGNLTLEPPGGLEDSTLEGEDEEAHGSPLLHYYLLRVPMIKFFLRLASDIAIAICATFAEGEPSIWIFLVWPLGGLISEYTQLVAADESTPTLFASLRNEVLSWFRSDVPSTYRADLFNMVDMLSLHLLLASEIAYYVAQGAYLPLRAFAVLALYVRLLRVIYIHPTFGALVLLLVRMTIDLVQLFVLLVFVVVSLVSALYVVEPTWTGSDELDREPRQPACDDFYILGGSWNNWAKLAFMVLNAVVDGRAQDALFMCVLHEENENRYLLWTFVYLLLLFVVVLLLNMLIAMFSRSFDLMYDSMPIHVQTAFARAVVAWCASTPEPPPLNLLQLPYRIIRIFLSLFHSQPHKADAQPEAASAISLTLVADPSVGTRSMAAVGGATSSATTPPFPTAGVIPHPGSCGASTDTSSSHGRRVDGGLRPSKVDWAIRHTHGTFSGLGLQPTVHRILHSDTAGESRDYEGTTVKSLEGVRNSWQIWKEKVRRRIQKQIEGRWNRLTSPMLTAFALSAFFA